jgi:hypothetical protein
LVLWQELTVGVYEEKFGPIIAAAQNWADLHTECEKCSGKGQEAFYDASWGVDLAQLDVRTCPACGGRGYTLDLVRLEASAKAIEDEIGGELREHLGHIMRKWPNTIAELAEAAILAYLGEPL